MHTSTKLALAATAVVSLGVPPGIGIAMECRQLCNEFLPNHSLTTADDYDCQDAIDDSGGSCTLNGRRNVFMELPRGIGYRREHYYYSDAFDAYLGDFDDH